MTGIFKIQAQWTKSQKMKSQGWKMQDAPVDVVKMETILV